MRKGFNGLGGLATSKLGQNPLSGDIFIFVNRTRTMIKILVWDQTGFAIWHKRLEQGTFEMPQIEKTQNSIEISRQKLMLILEGISLKSVQTRKRFLLKKMKIISKKQAKSIVNTVVFTIFTVWKTA